MKWLLTILIVLSMMGTAAWSLEINKPPEVSIYPIMTEQFAPTPGPEYGLTVRIGRLKFYYHIIINDWQVNYLRMDD